MEKAERERLMKLFQRRMDLARNGAVSFKQGKVKEAITNYYAYIDILEKTKEVERDGLLPKHFDSKKDIAEILLLSGVFWDLAKMHDQGGKKGYERLRLYLDRFVVFSAGMPFQHVSSELVRKFLVNGNPRHRKEFKDAHIRLGGGKCFIATAVEEHLPPQTLKDLRSFRDGYLLKRGWGRAFTSVYYAVGPWAARAVIRAPVSAQKGLAFLVKKTADALPVEFRR